MQLLLSKTSQDQFDNFIKNPPQSILLIAPKGSGKKTILEELARNITPNNRDSVLNIAFDPGKTSIGIDQIRQLKQSLKLKSIQQKAIIINDADALTVEAQNSFLKLLEEPPLYVHFLLGANNQSDLLDTIKSRTALWRLSQPKEGQVIEYYSKFPQDEVKKAYLIAQGRVGLIDSLLKKSSDHKLIKSIESAKEIMASNHFKRLAKIEPYSKDSKKTIELLDALAVISKAALEKAALNNEKNNTEKWLDRLENIIETSELVGQNIQIKLLLTRLFLVL